MTTPNNAPKVSVAAQFLRDLSFENIAAVKRMNIDAAPTIELNLDLDVKRFAETSNFEVVLKVNAKANVESNAIFVIEVIYGGIFSLNDIAEEDHARTLSVDCASLLFPYVRKIVADTVQYGSFQPLLIEPINFAELYEKRIAQEAAQNSKEN